MVVTAPLAKSTETKLTAYNNSLIFTTNDVTAEQVKNLGDKYKQHPNCQLFVKKSKVIFDSSLKGATENTSSTTRREFNNIFNQLANRLENSNITDQEFACYLFSRKLDALQIEASMGEVSPNSTN
ncbi:hypothetical protein CKF54_02105 [Psittacicella hinzii]|uniref:Uncharacterized protein n=1 Tax=Psittacicella hinzii TaxID=2028575 RepID=A0A3A1Y8A7_9GAMM|nr:hypothetical protein CKF54_02105 [Psittacicella hinzii]